MFDIYDIKNRMTNSNFTGLSAGVNDPVAQQAPHDGWESPFVHGGLRHDLGLIFHHHQSKKRGMDPTYAGSHISGADLSQFHTRGIAQPLNNAMSLTRPLPLPYGRPEHAVTQGPGISSLRPAAAPGNSGGDGLRLLMIGGAVVLAYMMLRQ